MTENISNTSFYFPASLLKNVGDHNLPALSSPQVLTDSLKVDLFVSDRLGDVSDRLEEWYSFVLGFFG
jgi:hypothetical protein